MYFEGRPGDLRPLGISAGVAVYPEDGHTHHELIAVADQRMYRHKTERKTPRAVDVRGA
jgi:GGDEF domain-containing protein